MGRKELLLKNTPSSCLVSWLLRPACCLVLCLVTFVFFSCDLFYADDSDFKDKLTGVFCSDYTFYADDPSSVGDPSSVQRVKIQYKIGSEQDFDESELSAIASVNATYPFIGWGYLYNPNTGDNLAPSNFHFDEDALITGAKVTPEPAVLYAIHGVSYKVIHQREDSSTAASYTTESTQIRYGVPGKLTNAQPKDYPGFSQEPYSQQTIASDGSTEVVIRYERISYTITFDTNGGTPALPQSVKYGVPTPLTPYAGTKSGYNFAGWSVRQNGSVSYGDGEEYTIGTQSVILYAVWTPKEYTVTLSCIDADTAGSTSVSAKYGSTLPAITIPVRQGYVFAGYNTESDGSGDSYYNANGKGSMAWSIASDTTLYAQWTPATNTPYTVRHWLQPDSLSMSTDDYELQTTKTQTLRGTTGEYSAAVPLVFAGFEAQSISQKTIDRNGLTVVDIYYDRASIPLTLDGNGGDSAGVTIATQSFRYGVPQQLPQNNFLRTGYTFDGWSTSQTGGKVYDDEGWYIIGASPATLYAVWKENTINVTVELPSYGLETELEVEVSTSGSSVSVMFEKGSAEPSVDYDDLPVSCITLMTGLAANKAGFVVDTSALSAGAVYDIYIEVEKEGTFYSRDIKLKVGG